MSDARPPAPAGWYPDQSGVQRYWDGLRWLDIPAPAAEALPARESTSKPLHRRFGFWAALTVAALVVFGGGAAAVIAAVHQADAAAAELEAEDAEEAEAASRAAEQERVEEVREQADERERAARAEQLPHIENSIRDMATGHIGDGLIDGEVLQVRCTPVDGYAIDNLDQPSAVLECFVATEDNGDGTMRGYDYNATVNWVTGQFSYGFGSP
ncbi:DUF2510 domain-containing protein [Agrococcus sediminis]|uniref:DUF2510 domain-containing protein n=1 Tax=Agrococcus sediminis TaxID=2599924 RepID=UPI0034365CC6